MQCSAALPVVLGGAHAMRGLAQAKNAGNYFWISRLFSLIFNLIIMASVIVIVVVLLLFLITNSTGKIQ